MVTTDLKLVAPGSLPKPGYIGRATRFLFGLGCLWYIASLVKISGSFFNADNQIKPLLWNGLFPGLLLISYVINIGFSRSWKKWPAIFSATMLITSALIGLWLEGRIENNFLARTVWLWELYIFFHLGSAFVIASTIATPGCEMRAYHHLYSRLTRIPTNEHCCPIGPLQTIDEWESQRFGRF